MSAASSISTRRTVRGLSTAFWRWGLAPEWWMKLRVLLTVLVVACLAVGVLL